MKRIVLIAGLMLTDQVNAKTTDTTLNLPLDYDLIRSVLVNQLYTQENTTARLWKDGKECSFLDLSDPRIHGEKGQIHIANQVHARIGVRLGGKCIPAVEWHGELKTTQKPLLEANGTQLSFPVTSIAAYDHQSQALQIDELEQLIHKAVGPKLAELKLDLNQSRPDIEHSLQRFVDADRAANLQKLVDSLRFQKVSASDKALDVGLVFSLPKPEKNKPEIQPVLSSEELKQWQSLWLGLDMRLQESLQQPPLQQKSEKLKDLLREMMEEAGEAFEQGLSEDASDKQHDPVHMFFKHSWEKMSPLLRQASTRLPANDSLRYLTLIAATDGIYELDNLASSVGLELSSQGLRQVVRSYLKSEQASGHL